MNIKLFLAAASSALALSMPGAASAASVLVGGYTLDDSTFGTGFGVHSDGTQSGSSISGHVNIDGSDVTFSTTTGILTDTGGGEATIYGDPSLQDLLVIFEKSWNNITFNFSDLDGAESNFTLLVNGTALFSATPNLGDLACTFCLINNGENKFTVSGEGINSLAFEFDPGIENAKQFRVEGVSGVPEPTTWAMMILGFGAVGAMLRHARRRPAAAIA
jgi:hypothetical protein